jgi:hypothetical protein
MGVRWHFDAVHEPGGVHFIIAADSLRSPLNSISLGGKTIVAIMSHDF